MCDTPSILAVHRWFTVATQGDTCRTISEGCLLDTQALLDKAVEGAVLFALNRVWASLPR